MSRSIAKDCAFFFDLKGMPFALEKETGSIEGLLMAPVDPDKLYLAKLLGNVTFLLTVEALTLPLGSALFNLPLFLPELWLLMILSTFGLAAVGTVFSAMAINTHAREILLPVLSSLPERLVIGL